MSMVLQIVLVCATLLCSLVAGLLFAFAVIVMPGIGNLGDREFIRAFQEIDGVIQRGQPIFGLVWLGSAVALVAGLALGLGQLADMERVLLVTAGGLYLFGVQLPTIRINIPLNNELQALQAVHADEAALRSARKRFEGRWNRWNAIRTALAILTAAILVVLLGLH